MIRRLLRWLFLPKKTFNLPLDRQKAGCKLRGHPGKTAVSSPDLGTTEYWCTFCDCYWLEDED